MKKKLFLVILSILCSKIFAGPFGLEMGMSLEQIQEACGGRVPEKENSLTDIYRIVPVKQHPYFNNYEVIVNSEKGLSYIRATGQTLSSDSYGIVLQSKFNDLKEALSKTYGESSHMDILLPYSTYLDSDEWVWSIYKKERYYADIWSLEYNSNLPGYISTIYLMIESNNYNSGYISLEYKFSNYEETTETVDNNDETSDTDNNSYSYNSNIVSKSSTSDVKTESPKTTSRYLNGPSNPSDEYVFAILFGRNIIDSNYYGSLDINLFSDYTKHFGCGLSGGLSSSFNGEGIDLKIGFPMRFTIGSIKNFYLCTDSSFFINLSENFGMGICNSTFLRFKYFETGINLRKVITGTFSANPFIGLTFGFDEANYFGK